MTRSSTVLRWVPAAALIAGCSSAVRTPHLLHPGPAPLQRGNAEVIDPYPLPDMGPEMVGARPREFDVPRNEVVRAQQYLRSSGARPASEAALAPVPVGPPVLVTQPYPTQAYPAQPNPGQVYPSQPATAGPRY